LNKRTVYVSWGYKGDKPEYVLDLLRPGVVGWVGLDSNKLERIEISEHFETIPYVKVDRTTMPQTQRIWGSGSTLYYDADGKRAEAYVIARYVSSQPPMTAAPVGGVMMPANNLAIVAPWLAVIGVVGCIGTIAVIAKKR
jgi:hypothetical protein